MPIGGTGLKQLFHHSTEAERLTLMLALIPSGCPVHQLWERQGRERQLWQHFDFMMPFCLASARSEGCLWWVNALWLETRQSGPCSGHHGVCRAQAGSASPHCA